MSAYVLWVLGWVLVVSGALTFSASVFSAIKHPDGSLERRKEISDGVGGFWMAVAGALMVLIGATPS